MGGNRFVDHFGGHAAEYSRSRPDYPEALFDWLATVTPANDLAWDCATGSGQAAQALARRFGRVVATDASLAQIRSATPSPRVGYVVGDARAVPVADAALDLITVAQALHWFHGVAFNREALRTLRPGGVLAVWTYGLFRTDEPIDRLIRHFHDHTVGPYWSPERCLVDSGYREIELPPEALPDVPPFTMTREWAVDEVLGYLGTWSAVKRAEAEGLNPLAELAESLRPAWPARRRVCWDLHLRVTRKASS